MESVEITSSRSLTTSIPERRPAGAHSYQVICRQFLSSYKSWQKNGATRGQALGVITAGFDRIWITAVESARIAEAIEAMSSPVALD